MALYGTPSCGGLLGLGLARPVTQQSVYSVQLRDERHGLIDRSVRQRLWRYGYEQSDGSCVPERNSQPVSQSLSDSS